MAERTVACPHCKGSALYSPRNSYRPFCSLACRQGDWRDWASEHFKLPDEVEITPGNGPSLG
ncbi:MAG: DNA gyrase inhibitor YacG [Burkholderiaceae bacterium]|nr:DNA gyrase inhibitor YacG [Burkholderiaceae bacterium]